MQRDQILLETWRKRPEFLWMSIDIVRGMLCDQNSFYGVGLVRSHPLRKGKASPHNVDLIFSLNWKWTLFMPARKTKKRNGTRLPTKSSHSLNNYASYCLGNFYFISAFIIARYILWFTVLLLHHEQPGNILQSYQHLHSWRHVNHCTAGPDICPLKPGFHIVVSVVSVVSVVRREFIGQIEFIPSRTSRCICRFFCIEHLYGRFP